MKRRLLNLLTALSLLVAAASLVLLVRREVVQDVFGREDQRGAYVAASSLGQLMLKRVWYTEPPADLVLRRRRATPGGFPVDSPPAAE
jgi:hypothetical protein